MEQRKKTKIVATLGPASARADVIGRMIESGVNVFRMNFSHGTLESHGRVLEAIREAADRADATVAIMGDLPGPKIRTSRIEPEPAMLERGHEVEIVPADVTGDAKRFGTNYMQFLEDVREGQRILIDDGQLALRVLRVESDRALCRVEIGGELKSRKGINLPDSDLSTPSITDYDWQCIDWAVEHELDFLAMSFVRRADDVAQLKGHLQKAGSPIHVVSKVETPQAIRDLEAIVRRSDAVLVARGDLGVEMPFEEVPILQKRMTHLCRDLGRPVIVATQMLQSMIHSATATRAEVSDVANAIMDYADAVMLSGETAVGEYPVTSVETMQRIATVTEAYLDESPYMQPLRVEAPEMSGVTAGLIAAVGRLVEDVNARLVAVWSEDGLSARLLSKARVDVPVLAFSSSAQVCRWMCMQYGLVPCRQDVPADPGAFIELVEEAIRCRDLARPSEHILVLADQPLNRPQSADALLVHTLSH